MLSTSLESATLEMMKANSIAREVFGDEFVDHYGGTREHEIKLWNEAVTSWEGECRTWRFRRVKMLIDFIPVERYLELA